MDIIRKLNKELGITILLVEQNAKLALNLSSRSYIMENGKKGTAEKIFYGALDEISTMESEMSSLDIFKAAIENVMPSVEVKSRRVGGSTYQVPMEVRQERGTAMALRWLVNFSRARNGRSMAQKLAGELIDAANEAGSAVRKREETHKMAEANKAFSHYRW